MDTRPYIWDSWYWFDNVTGLFHVYYLNVDNHDLVPREEHHFHARIGYATTRDFIHYDFQDHAVVNATDVATSRDNTSIWTGCSVAYGKGSDRLMAYTSRDSAQGLVEGWPRPFTQHISFATSNDGLHWERVKSAHVDADANYFSTQSIQGDVVIHAWRDPVIFRVPGSDYAYMLLCAHDAQLPHGVKGERNGEHGVIALLRSKHPHRLTSWIATGIRFAVAVPEAEVPRIYIDKVSGRHMIAYSCKNAEAYVPFTPDKSAIEYGFYGFFVDMEALAKHSEGDAPASKLISVADEEKIPLLAYGEDALYACQIVPELGGRIIGFDTLKGVIRHSDVRNIENLTSASLDFREFSL